MNIDTSNLNYMQTILADGTFRQAACRISPEEVFTELFKGQDGKWFCTYSDPAIDGVRSAVNGSDSSAVRGWRNL